jgi:hypothetical protein
LLCGWLNAPGWKLTAHWATKMHFLLGEFNLGQSLTGGSDLNQQGVQPYFGPAAYLFSSSP